MRFSGLRRFWLVVATLSLIATPAIAEGALSFVCERDFVARTECCCPEGHPGGTAGAGDTASVSAACCCRVSRTDVREAPAVAQPRAAAQTDAQVLLEPTVAPPDDVVVPNAQAWPAVRLAHPPPRAVPILLGKQSFLV